MRIERPVSSLSTYIILDATDMVTNHQDRYYAVPKDYRMSENPQDGDPYIYSHAIEGHPDAKIYLEALSLMSQMYWKIIADGAEATYKADK